MEAFLFGLLGLSAIGSATAMILSRNAVHSALFLIANFGCVAILFLMLDAPFISMVQIAVYAGAIMVLFLFVIMLLGAEQATDAVQRFPWITRAAVVLGVSFLFALGTPLLLTGFTLPDPPGADPMLRVAHVANVGTATNGARPVTQEPVDVIISGDALEEDLVIEDLAYSDVTDFVSVPAGDYSISLAVEAGTFATLQASLAEGDIFTTVAYGERDTTDIAAEDSFGLPFGVTFVPNSFDGPSIEGARVQILNVYSTDAQTLVNLGPNRVIDPQTDVVLQEAVAYGDFTEAFELREGDYALAFYGDDEFAAETIELQDYIVAAGTEQTVILAPDYGASLTSDNFYRARVLDRAQETLVINTADTFGSPGDIGLLLFTDYLLPVNMVGFLLLVGLVGVIVLTRPEGEKRPRRAARRRKVSRPLVNVISQQTGGDVIVEPPRLKEGD